MVEAIQHENLKGKGVAMRRRLRKKKDLQRIFESINWCFGEAADVIHEYVDKMDSFKIRWRRNVPSLTFPAHPIYPVSNCSSGISMLIKPMMNPLTPELWDKAIAKKLMDEINNPCKYHL